MKTPKSIQGKQSSPTHALGISGFLTTPKKAGSGGVFTGRFTCLDVQWTGLSSDRFVTFTVSAEELAAVAENNLLWTDQEVQRGVQPGLAQPPPRELTLAGGYPDPTKYVFEAAKADEIADKLLSGSRLFLSPLIWNLRPGHFQAYHCESERKIYIYDGRIYLPDSHHRHQAIVKAVHAWRDEPSSYPDFSGDRQFKVELYFLDRADEGNYFYDKNQLPKPTAKSKAYDLTTQDDLSLLAKEMIKHSSALANNVNRVTDRLSNRNPQVVTLSTIREMMRAFSGGDVADQAEMGGLARAAAEFYDLLAEARSELGLLSVEDRRRARRERLVDAAVMMHGYVALMVEYNLSVGKDGARKAKDLWRRRLARLSATHRYELDRWSGDFFDKKNPLWLKLGVVKPSRNRDDLTVMNTGAARAVCGRALSLLVTVEREQSSLDYIAKA